MGADHRPRSGCHETLKVFICYASICIRRNKGEGYLSFRFQPIQRPQNGIMLQIRSDHMIAGSKQSIQSNVQSLCGVAGKDHMICPRTTEKRRQLFSGGVYPPGSVQGFLMGTPGAVAHGMHGRKDGLRHLRWLMQGSSGVIQIDHGLMTLPAPASFSTMVYILVTEPTASFSVRP